MNKQTKVNFFKLKTSIWDGIGLLLIIFLVLFAESKGYTTVIITAGFALMTVFLTWQERRIKAIEKYLSGRNHQHNGVPENK